MPRIQDPGFYDKVIRALQLREQVAAEVGDEISLVIDVSSLLTALPGLQPGAQSTVGGPLVDPRILPPGASGHGVLKIIQVTTPVAGSQWAQVVPAGVLWKIRGMTMLFSTSATVANRVVAVGTFQVPPVGGAITVHFCASTITEVASNGGRTYFFEPAVGRDAQQQAPPGGLVTVSMGIDWQILGGDSINSQVGGLQATDALSGIFLQVEEFIYP